MNVDPPPLCLANSLVQRTLTQIQGLPLGMMNLTLGPTSLGGRLRHNIPGACEALRNRCRASSAYGLSSTKAILSPRAHCRVSPGGKGMGNGNPPLEGARRIASLRLDRSIVSQPAPPTQQAPMIPPPLAPLPPQPPPFLISLGHTAFLASQPRTYSKGRACRPLQALWVPTMC